MQLTADEWDLVGFAVGAARAEFGEDVAGPLLRKVRLNQGVAQKTDGKNVPLAPIPELKHRLLAAGNYLADVRGYERCALRADDLDPEPDSLLPLAMFIAWMSRNPEAQAVLREFGICWE